MSYFLLHVQYGYTDGKLPGQKRCAVIDETSDPVSYFTPYCLKHIHVHCDVSESLDFMIFGRDYLTFFLQKDSLIIISYFPFISTYIMNN